MVFTGLSMDFRGGFLKLGGFTQSTQRRREEREGVLVSIENSWGRCSFDGIEERGFTQSAQRRRKGFAAAYYSLCGLCANLRGLCVKKISYFLYRHYPLDWPLSLASKLRN